MLTLSNCVTSFADHSKISSCSTWQGLQLASLQNRFSRSSSSGAVMASVAEHLKHTLTLLGKDLLTPCSHIIIAVVLTVVHPPADTFALNVPYNPLLPAASKYGLLGISCEAHNEWHHQRCRLVSAAPNKPLLLFTPFFMASCLPCPGLSPSLRTLCAAGTPW